MPESNFDLVDEKSILQPSSYTTTTDKQEIDPALKPLLKRIYFEDTVTITVDGQVIHPFKSSLFFIYRMSSRTRPLLILKSAMGNNEELITRQIKEFLEVNKQDEQLADEIIGTFIKVFRLHFSDIRNAPETQEKFENGIYEICGYDKNNIKVRAIKELLGEFHPKDKLTDTYFKNLYPRIVPEVRKIFHARMSNNLQDINSIKNLAKLTLSRFNTDSSLREQVMQQIRKLHESVYMKDWLNYIAKNKDFIILIPSSPDEMKLMQTYMKNNAKGDGVLRAFALPASNFICVPIATYNVLIEYEKKFLAESPAIFGGIVKENIDNDQKFSPVGTFQSSLVEEIHDYIYFTTLRKKISNNDLDSFNLSITNIKNQVKVLLTLANKIIKDQPLNIAEENLSKVVQEKIDELSKKEPSKSKILLKKFDNITDLYIGKEISLNTEYQGNDVDFVVKSGFVEEEIIFGLLEAKPMEENDHIAWAFILKEFASETLSMLSWVSNGYKEYAYSQELMGKIPGYFLKYAGLAEYVFRELLPFYNNLNELIRETDKIEVSQQMEWKNNLDTSNSQTASQILYARHFRNITISLIPEHSKGNIKSEENFKSRSSEPSFPAPGSQQASEKSLFTEKGIVDQLANIGKTIFGVPNTTLAEHAAVINSLEAMIKPSSEQYLRQNVNRTSSLKEKMIAGQYWFHYLRKLSPFTLPWNQERSLTEADKKDLKKYDRSIQDFEKRIPGLINSPLIQCGILKEELEFAEKLCIELSKNIRKAQKNNEITDSLSSYIKNKVSRIEEILDEIEQQNEQYINLSKEIDSKEEDLVSTGQQSSIKINYNPVSKKLTYEIVKNLPDASAQPTELHSRTLQEFWEMPAPMSEKPIAALCSEFEDKPTKLLNSK